MKKTTFKNLTKKNLLHICGSIDVSETADQNGDDRENDASERHGRKLADEDDPDADDGAHDVQQDGAINSEIIVHYARIFGEISENR